MEAEMLCMSVRVYVHVLVCARMCVCVGGGVLSARDPDQNLFHTRQAHCCTPCPGVFL